MASRSQSRLSAAGSKRRVTRGSVSLQLAVILVPVIFGFFGFALDLGRLYLIRGELNQAANSIAVRAASQLIGTTTTSSVTKRATPQL